MTSGQGPLWGWLLVGAVAAGRGSVRVFEGLLVRVLLTLVTGFELCRRSVLLAGSDGVGLCRAAGQLFPISFNIYQN